MRWSQAFIPTLRDDPADAEAVSHKLLVRAGFIRQLSSGIYSLLPLGFRVCQKITEIVRSEMEAIGAQEFRLPAIHPAEIWQRSGRWEAMGEEMFRLDDRRGADMALGMTHEEIFATIACELRSYKQLPQIWYQIQTKFRDEPRPKSGVLRVREFTMKDSYSLDIRRDGLDSAFQRHFEAYRKIFSRCGLDTIAVEASSGTMGGSESVEFMVASDAGEDWIASCSTCGYAGNVEKATSGIPAVEDGEGLAAPEKFPTPGVRTIEDLVTFDGGAPADRQIKTLVYVVDGADDPRAASGRPRPRRAEAPGRNRRRGAPPRDRRRDSSGPRRVGRQPRRRRRERSAHRRGSRAPGAARHGDRRQRGRPSRSRGGRGARHRRR